MTMAYQLDHLISALERICEEKDRVETLVLGVALLEDACVRVSAIVHLAGDSFEKESSYRFVTGVFDGQGAPRHVSFEAPDSLLMDIKDAACWMVPIQQLFDAKIEEGREDWLRAMWSGARTNPAVLHLRAAHLYNFLRDPESALCRTFSKKLAYVGFELVNRETASSRWERLSGDDLDDREAPLPFFKSSRNTGIS